MDERMILDVGCGSRARGDVNVDLLVPDSLRGWDLNPKGIQNFVRADVRALPFRSRIFDLVYCSHLIEHIPDYEGALEELKRVSRKYVAVIVPFVLFAPLFDFLYHGRKYGRYLRWLRAHHKHNWLMDPFKTGSFRLMWRKFLGIPIPFPFETLTLWEVHQAD